MSMQTVLKRFAHTCMALILAVVMICSLTAFSLDVSSFEDDSTLNLNYQVNSKPVADVQFDLYRIASMDESLQFTWTSDFKKYRITFDYKSEGALNDLANTLSGYIQRDSIVPYATDVTGENGIAIFSVLRPGMYLVCGHSYYADGYTYTPVPLIVFLPYTGEAGSWIHTADIDVKHERVPEPGDEELETVSKRVIKVWSGDNIATRPRSVTVQLLKDGKVSDTVVLNQENNWKHTWTDLDAKSVYRVVEMDVPDNYTVSVQQQGNVFIVTNSVEKDEPDIPTTPPDTPPDTDEPTVPPDTDGPTTTPDIEEPTPNTPIIPQTGLLWWPVPVLAAVGIFSLIMGMVFRRRERRDEK